MSTLRQAAEMALEALEYGQHTLKQIGENQWESRGQLAVQALRAALAEPTVKESLQVESAVAEIATTQQQLDNKPPSDYRRGYWDGFAIGKREGRIEAEDALAEPVQEPVAYIHRQGNHWEVSERELVDDERARGWTEEPLYTAPPQRKPLTEEEIEALFEAELLALPPYPSATEELPVRLARAIERAHGIT